MKKIMILSSSIYEEAERLKKIANRAGNGKVKILDDKTIEFSIE